MTSGQEETCLSINAEGQAAISEFAARSLLLAEELGIVPT